MSLEINFNRFCHIIFILTVTVFCYNIFIIITLDYSQIYSFLLYWDTTPNGSNKLKLCWVTMIIDWSQPKPQPELLELATVRRKARDSTSVTYAYGIWDCWLTVLHCHMVEESWWRNGTLTSSVRQILTLSSCATNVRHYTTYLQSTLSSWMSIIMVNYIWMQMDNGYKHRHLRLYWQLQTEGVYCPLWD